MKDVFLPVLLNKKTGSLNKFLEPAFLMYLCHIKNNKL